ncbi:hypothetical protein, partial [Agreia sp.]|uniref:hypothetical protein n=1 Tax=Agreia sp. TaxID=1872416 RepID=UPI0035BC65D6
AGRDRDDAELHLMTHVPSLGRGKRNAPLRRELLACHGEEFLPSCPKEPVSRERITSCHPVSNSLIVDCDEDKVGDVRA